MLLDEAELRGDTVRLADRRARHITDVLRCRPGDRVRAGLVRGPIGVAEVLQAGEGFVDARLALTGDAPPRPALGLILALPRPKAFRRVLQTAAALGVDGIDVVNAWRVERSYFSSPRLDQADMEEQLRLGCEQGAQTWVPHLRVHERLLPFLESLPAHQDGAEARILAHPAAQGGVESLLPAGERRRVLLAVGPEGGWVDTELSSFAGLGFRAATIVRGILRTEDAVAAALAQIELVRRSTAEASAHPWT